MSVRILIGDATDRLADLADESVHCVVTSPPYWGLRDYGVKGQLGLEPTLGEHLDVMVRVFREVRRVMRPDATLWLNYGDCYAGSWGAQGHRETPAGMHGNSIRNHPKTASHTGTIRDSGLKPKDLCMVPNRLAIALQDDGWWVRSEIVWGKPNGMPDSSGKYRPSTAHEKIFLLSKTGTMFYDSEAVKMPAVGRTEHDLTGPGYAAPGQTPQTGNRQKYKMPDGWDTGPGAHGSVHRQGREKGAPPDKQRGHSRRHAGFNDRWDQMTKAEQQENGRLLRNYEPDLSAIIPPEVWHIATTPFPDAHFATFPPALVMPCIAAGTSERGVCADCGAPWARETKRVDQGWDGSRYGENAVAATGGAKTGGTAKSTLGSNNGKLTGKQETTGWSPSCTCNAAAVPATVLDPFAGAGTTGLVADRLGRDAILIEINPEYAEMARKRIYDDAPLFIEPPAKPEQQSMDLAGKRL